MARVPKHDPDIKYPQTQSKLPDSGTSIFAEMSALAVEHQAINLSQGFPDYPMSDELIGLTWEAMKAGFNQYAPMPGWPALREAIAEKIQSLYQVAIDPATEITITPGGTYAIYATIATLVHPGDEVIVLEPAYDCYIPAVQVHGGIPVRIPLKYPEYRVDWALVREKVSPRTRLILLNSPHNPTGSVLLPEDIAQLVSLVRETQILILSDEVYEHLIFDGLQHQAMLSHPELFQRSISVFSFGKLYHNTGWKVGYCVGPQPLMKEFRKIHQFLAFSTHTPSQVAFAQFLKKKEAYLFLPQFFQQKRDEFREMLKETRLDPLPCSGSYFQLVSYRRISQEPDKEFAIRLTREFQVAAIPVSAFYQDHHDDQVLRFCFAKKTETLQQAVSRLARL
ncbi:MAG TPA: methionine aminotransferase [Chitinophagaceae bacterium]|nr:methionine aminotransferase [Chitinophagaceae bacterium]